MLRHIVLFKLHQDTTSNQKDEALKLLRELGKQSDGIMDWVVEVSNDTRKGIILVENGLFRDTEAYKRFRDSDEHIRVGEFMKQIADWWIADYSE